ncbi:MAG TPA: geranylgeranyl reductase, partial [Firmicutes bacterium]|nr:geranylgeranyl reductase [Bacillota bacterium]
AGSACARLLAQAGAKVLLLEKARFPREKSCGGLLSGKTLASIDAPLPDRLVLSKVHGMRMVAEDGKLQAESGHLPGRAVLVDRSQFDWWMVERACQAGAVYRDACEVVRIANGREMATVYLIGGALVAKWVVGADGAAS